MFCFGGGGFRRGQSRLFATSGSANPLACTRWQGPQYQPVSGARRRQAEANPTLCVPTSPLVAPACSWVCARLPAQHMRTMAGGALEYHSGPQMAVRSRLRLLVGGDRGYHSPHWLSYCWLLPERAVFRLLSPLRMSVWGKCLYSRGGPTGNWATPVLFVSGEVHHQGGHQQAQRCPHSVARSRLRGSGLGRTRRLSQAAPPVPTAARYFTQGRGFRVEERPQVFLLPGQPRAGRNIHRVQPGGPAAPPTFRQRGRAV
ncbi:hypothetical protein NDU88_006078 [Pleurodeles waltl]|uniref:Uncharacterized protein n=1 Tax=Pleurodeles waltl TaxID=8319 RepID=A0AAV7RP36_PLEWA|nr:hypothetical protein NDU88_006078 [Pleurodeles waltl]